METIKLKEPYQKFLTPRAVCKSITPLAFYNRLNYSEQQSLQRITDSQKIGQKIIKAGKLAKMEPEPCLFMYAKPHPSDKGTLYFIIISKDYEMIAFDIKNGNKIKFTGKICYQLVKGNRKIQFALTSGLIMKLTVKKSFDKLGTVVQDFFENPYIPYYVPILTSISELTKYPDLFPELKEKILPLLFSPSCDFLIKLQCAKIDQSILKKISQAFVILAIKHKVISYTVSGLINLVLQTSNDYSAFYSPDSFLGNIMVVVSTKQNMDIVRKLISKFIKEFSLSNIETKIQGIVSMIKQVRVHPNTAFVMTILYHKLKANSTETVAMSVIARILLTALQHEAITQNAPKDIIEAFNILLTVEAADESMSSILGFVHENFIGNSVLIPKAIGPREVVSAHQLLIKLLVRHGGEIRDAIDNALPNITGFSVPGSFVTDLIAVSNKKLEKYSSRRSFASGEHSSKRRSAILKRSSGSVSVFSATGSQESPPVSVFSDETATVITAQTANSPENQVISTSSDRSKSSTQSSNTKSSESPEAVEPVLEMSIIAQPETNTEEIEVAPQDSKPSDYSEEETSSSLSDPSSTNSLIDFSDSSDSMEVSSSNTLSGTTRGLTSGTWSD